MKQYLSPTASHNFLLLAHITVSVGVFPNLVWNNFLWHDMSPFLTAASGNRCVCTLDILQHLSWLWMGKLFPGCCFYNWNKYIMVTWYQKVGWTWSKCIAKHIFYATKHWYYLSFNSTEWQITVQLYYIENKLNFLLMKNGIYHEGWKQKENI